MILIIEGIVTQCKCQEMPCKFEKFFKSQLFIYFVFIRKIISSNLFLSYCAIKGLIYLLGVINKLQQVM